MYPKPQYVEGIMNGNGDALCWSCMSEAAYAASEIEGSDLSPIFFDTESDYRYYCQECGDKINHNLTEDGLEYELMNGSDESCYVVTGSFPGCLPDYEARYASFDQARSAIREQFEGFMDDDAQTVAGLSPEELAEVALRNPTWIVEGDSFEVGNMIYEIDYHYAAN